MRTVIFLAFLVAAFFVAANASAPPPKPKPSFIAFVYDLNGGHGSGVFIAPDKVITARHVVLGEEVIKVRDETGGIYYVKSIEYSKDGNDFAIITLEKPADVELAKVDCTPPAPLTELTIVGYPLDLTLQTRYVRVSGYGYIDISEEVRGVDPSMPVMWVDGILIPGDSGGPVFSKKGVVGLSDGILNSPFGGQSGLAYVFPLAHEPLVCPREV